jgi:hypothetical protein
MTRFQSIMVGAMAVVVAIVAATAIILVTRPGDGGSSAASPLTSGSSSTPTEQPPTSSPAVVVHDEGMFILCSYANRRIGGIIESLDDGNSGNWRDREELGELIDAAELEWPPYIPDYPADGLADEVSFEADIGAMWDLLLTYREQLRVGATPPDNVAEYAAYMADWCQQGGYELAW